MKPQDSSDSSLPHSSQILGMANAPEEASAQKATKTPEGAHADASLVNLTAHLERLNIEKIKNTPFNRAELKDIIAGLEQHNADGSWSKNYYDILDLYMMPALVDQANRKYSEMNLKLATPPDGFALALKETLANGIKSSRLIVNAHDRGIHFAVVDHQTVDGKTSLIFLEPTSLRDTLPALLALRTRQSIEDHQLPNIHLAMAEMDIQRSSSECGMFSLSLAKKLYLEADKLERLHRDNIKGMLCEPDTPLPPEKLDPYLPARLYKHVQGRRRLEQYLKANPQAAHEKVNKKQETLTERFEKNLSSTETKTVSVSQHRKRATEYKSLMM